MAMPSKVSEWVKGLREPKGESGRKMSAAAMAEKLERAGASIHPGSIYRWEAGEEVPADYRLLEMMDAFAIGETERRYVFDLAREERLQRRSPAAVAS